MDTLNPDERSRNMSAIRSRNTRPEIALRRWLFARGLRYRLNVRDVPGRPDIFFPRFNVAVFVNGCYWHRHKGCKYAYTPKSRIEFWMKKFDDNVRRDRVVCEMLKERQIRRLVVWECTIRRMVKDEAFRSQKLEEIVLFLKSGVENQEF